MKKAQAVVVVGWVLQETKVVSLEELRSEKASFVAAEGGSSAWPWGGPPQTSRTGCSHLIAPVHGWRIA